MYWGVDTPKRPHINPRQYGPYADNQTQAHPLALAVAAGGGSAHVLKVMDSFGDGWGEGAYWELLRAAGDGPDGTDGGDGGGAGSASSASSASRRLAGGPVEGRVFGFGSTVVLPAELLLQ